jgi:hypothetical protein
VIVRGCVMLDIQEILTSKPIAVKTIHASRNCVQTSRRTSKLRLVFAG